MFQIVLYCDPFCLTCQVHPAQQRHRFSGDDNLQEQDQPVIGSLIQRPTVACPRQLFLRCITVASTGQTGTHSPQP